MRADMKGRGVTRPTRAKTPDTEAPAPEPSGSQSTPLNWATGVEPSQIFVFKECQDLVRKRLGEPMFSLISQLTGLRLHVLWHRPLDFQGPGEMLVLCPMTRQQTGLEDPRPERCKPCLQRRWKLTLEPANQGRQFIGGCGITNFCACLCVDKVCPVTLVLQAAVAPRSVSSHGVSQGRNTGFLPERAGKPVSPATFHHAVALVRLILHDLESTAEARMARSGLEGALRRLHNAEIEGALLRGELRHRLPDLPESTVQPGLGSHAQRLVEAMLDYVRQHGLHPVSLDELASAMKMNASYLSAVFSQTTGVTFHEYLEEVRLSKAKELLRDPRNRVGEVACAAGYASGDSFRHAFKAHEGLSPEDWRAGQ